MAESREPVGLGAVPPPLPAPRTEATAETPKQRTRPNVPARYEGAVSVPTDQVRVTRWLSLDTATDVVIPSGDGAQLIAVDSVWVSWLRESPEQPWMVLTVSVSGESWRDGLGLRSGHAEEGWGSSSWLKTGRDGPPAWLRTLVESYAPPAGPLR